MEVLVKVPQSIEDRFQFIPEAELPGILARLIEAGLNGTGSQAEKEPVPELAELLDAIRNLQKTDMPRNVQPSVGVAAVGDEAEETNNLRVSAPMLEVGDEGDLDDFLDLLK